MEFLLLLALGAIANFWLTGDGGDDTQEPDAEEQQSSDPEGRGGPALDDEGNDRDDRLAMHGQGQGPDGADAERTMPGGLPGDSTDFSPDEDRLRLVPVDSGQHEDSNLDPAHDRRMTDGGATLQGPDALTEDAGQGATIETDPGAGEDIALMLAQRTALEEEEDSGTQPEHEPDLSVPQTEESPPPGLASRITGFDPHDDVLMIMLPDGYSGAGLVSLAPSGDTAQGSDILLDGALIARSDTALPAGLIVNVIS